MATFAQAYPMPAGDFSYGACFDGIPLTPSPSGYLMTPPPYRISTDPSQPRTNMAFQPGMNQMADASFFDEAIGTSTMSADMSLGFPPPSPQYMTSTGFHRDLTPRNSISSPVKREPKPQRRSRNSKKSKEVVEARDKKAPGSSAGESKPKRRSRKSKPEPELLDDEVEGSDDDNPKDPRRRRILERNRIAATKCRLRKRDEASALASQEQAMEDQNRYLSACFDSLTAEIYHLKTQLLCHTDCNCVLIQKYIAHEANRTVDGLISSSPAFDPHRTPSLGIHRGSSGSGASVTDSYGIPTPKMETGPPTWTNPFQQDSSPLEVGDDMFDMVLEPFQKDTAPVTTQSMSHIPSIERCDPGSLLPSPQILSPDGMVWGSQWEYR